MTSEQPGRGPRRAPMMYRPDDFSWLDYVRTYQTTARCLENQPIYPLDVHEGMLDDWLAGPPDPEPPGPDDFRRTIAAAAARHREAIDS